MANGDDDNGSTDGMGLLSDVLAGDFSALFQRPTAINISQLGRRKVSPHGIPAFPDPSAYRPDDADSMISLNCKTNAQHVLELHWPQSH